LEEFIKRKEWESNGLLLIQKMKEESRNESDSEEAMKRGAKAGNRHDIVVRTNESPKATGPGGVVVPQNFFKSSKKNATMFPSFEDKVIIDEYGYNLK